MADLKIDHISYGGENYEFVDQYARDKVANLDRRVSNFNDSTTQKVEAEKERALAAEDALQRTKVDKVPGKQLSTNDFTDELKNLIKNPELMHGATPTSDGLQGIVPKPTKNDASKFLCGNGTWQIPHDTTYDVATHTVDGLMSGADKLKLDKMEDMTDELSSAYISIRENTILETLGNGRIKQTTFNADGTITQTISKEGIPTIVLHTTFNDDGSINRTREEITV